MIIDQLFTQPIFEAADPSRLIATITLSQAYNADEPTKEVDLTGRFQGDVKSQMNQAADYLTQFLQSKGFNFTSIQLKYQGMVMNAQNRGSMTPQSDWEKEAEATANQMRAKRPVQNTAPALKEFAPSDDGDGPDQEELLRRMAAHWWNGNERQMAKVENTLAAMGWEIGQDDGYDDGGVFVVRAGDEHGRSYISWPHEELDMNEAAPPGARAERMVKHIKQGYARDGKLTPKEKGIAFATAWKAHNAGRIEEATEDEYQDDYADEETELCNGCYVRDKEDSSGEIFVMRGDPGDRRVRIEDRHGRGWNIAPYRLTVVDDSDPDIAAYFGDQLDEAGVTEAAQGHTIEAHGVRGMDRRTWHKTFKNTDQMIAWAEKHDAEIVGTRDLEQARHGNLSPARQGKKIDEVFADQGSGSTDRDNADYMKRRNAAKKAAAKGSVTKKPQPYNDPGWIDKLSKEQLDAIAGPRRNKDKKDVTEGVAETVSMDQAKKVLRRYGADHFKTTTNELHFYKNGRPMNVDLIFNSDATRSVSLSQLNSATRKLKGQGITEMDKSEPSAGRDGPPRPGPDREAKPISKEKMTKDAADVLDKAMSKEHKKKDVREGDIEQTRTGIRHRGHRYGSGEELPNGGGNRSGFPNPGKYARDLDHLDKNLTSKLDHSMGVSWPHGNKKRDMDENIDPLMKKLQRALVREGRVKELADDLKTMNDADFMKKYGKAKAAIRADMKRVDEAGISRLGKKDIEPEFNFRDGLVGDEPEFFEPDVRIGKPVDPNAADTDAFMSAVNSEKNPYMQSWGGKYADQDTNNSPLRPGEFNAGGTTWRFLTPGEKPGSDTISGTGTPDWRSIAAASKPAAASGLPKMRFDRATNSLVPVDEPVALDLSPKTKDIKSGANANIDAATRDRARAWAAKQNAPADTAKKKADWKTIYALNKATIGNNPNVIRAGMKLKMPDGSTYRVQSGDNLSKIAAGQINELSTNKLAQYKTAAAKDAKEADKEGDFKRGDKRFHGIVQATKKQFDNDAKKVDESRAARRALMARIVNSR